MPNAYSVPSCVTTKTWLSPADGPTPCTNDAIVVPLFHSSFPVAASSAYNTAGFDRWARSEALPPPRSSPLDSAKTTPPTSAGVTGDTMSRDAQATLSVGAVPWYASCSATTAPLAADAFALRTDPATDATIVRFPELSSIVARPVIAPVPRVSGSLDESADCLLTRRESGSVGQINAPVLAAGGDQRPPFVVEHDRRGGERRVRRAEPSLDLQCPWFERNDGIAVAGVGSRALSSRDVNGAVGGKGGAISRDSGSRLPARYAVRVVRKLDDPHAIRAAAPAGCRGVHHRIEQNRSDRPRTRWEELDRGHHIGAVLRVEGVQEPATRDRVHVRVSAARCRVAPEHRVRPWSRSRHRRIRWPRRRHRRRTPPGRRKPWVRRAADDRCAWCGRHTCRSRGRRADCTRGRLPCTSAAASCGTPRGCERGGARDRCERARTRDGRILRGRSRFEPPLPEQAR